jgi:hypothetical protein
MRRLDCIGQPRSGRDIGLGKRSFGFGFPWILSSGINLFNGLRGLGSEKWFHRVPSLPDAPAGSRANPRHSKVCRPSACPMKTSYSYFCFSAIICLRFLSRQAASRSRAARSRHSLDERMSRRRSYQRMEESVMRLMVVSVLVLLAMASQGSAQDDSGANRGVFAPPSSALGKLPGVNAPPSSSPGDFSGVIGATSNGSAVLGPVVTIPGRVGRGDVLPQNVEPAPIPGRPGYGSVMVNGRRATVDQNNRIVDIGD